MSQRAKHSRKLVRAWAARIEPVVVSLLHPSWYRMPISSTTVARSLAGQLADARGMGEPADDGTVEEVARVEVWLLAAAGLLAARLPVLDVLVVSNESGPVYAEEESVVVEAPIPWGSVLVLAEGLTVDKLVEYADVVAMFDGIWYTAIPLISQLALAKYVGLLPTNSTHESRLFRPAA